MTTNFQITENEIISGVCKSIYDVFGNSLNIYKEEEQSIETPAVTVYCANYDKVMERFDRFTNTFDIIINYFYSDNIKINNRNTMNSEVEKIMDAIRYIKLPAYKKGQQNNLIEITLPTKGSNISAKETTDGFMQIGVNYTVRTKKYENFVKMEQLETDVIYKQ